MTGKQTDAVAVSTRIRLARNLADLPFPGRMNREQQRDLLSRAGQAMTNTGQFTLTELDSGNRLLAQAWVERHIISPVFARSEAVRGVAISRDETCHVMIGEEDHLRIQVLQDGLCLDECLETAVKLDELLEDALPYAFDTSLGYLTACPSNLGTGLRASLMLHLPAIFETGGLRDVVAAAGQLGLTVRGVYGEGSAAAGYLFQLSNQQTLGASEEELAARLGSVAKRVRERELGLRAAVRRHDPAGADDRVWRAVGVLKHARRISVEEATKLLSEMLIGISAGVLETLRAEQVYRLMIDIQPAGLCLDAGRDLNAGERDVRRAELLRNSFSDI